MTRLNKQEEFTTELRGTLHPGDTIHTVLRRVSPSGMTRWIDVYRIEDDDPYRLSYLTAKTLGWIYDERREAIKVVGAGMDMGFHLVYALSRRLFPDGFECVGLGCPSNDHSNGDRDYKPHHHQDGGYALRQRWL